MKSFSSVRRASCRFCAAGAFLAVMAVTAVQAAEPATAPSVPWTMQRAWGSERLTLSGTFRARYENLAGQPRANFRPDDELLSTRTSLLAQYDLGVLRFGAELWDSRAWLSHADSPIGTNEVDAIELVQAYVAADFDKPLRGVNSASLQAGRFLINLGSRRLLSTDDYRNTANGFTGLRSVVKSAGGLGLDAFYTWPQLRLPDDLAGIRHNQIRTDQESSDTVVYGVMLTTPRRYADGLVEAGVVGFRERDAPARASRDRALRTWILRYLRDPAPGKWDWELEASLQYGEARTGLAAAAPLRDVEASFYHLRLGYQWNRPWKPRLSVDYDLVSGEGSGSKSHRYDTLFGMRRPDLAPSGLYSLVGRANIDSPALRLEAAPNRRLDFMLVYRALWLASATDAFSTIGIRDPTGQAGEFAGHQFDARVRYWLLPAAVRLELNALHLAKGRFLQEAPNARRNGDANFLALSVQATF
jgi:hypothetical protein